MAKKWLLPRVISVIIPIAREKGTLMFHATK